MSKEGMNRKGQEGLTLTTLLLIVLGIVVVVIIILGFTGGFDFIFGKVKLLPGQDLQAVVTSCQLAAQNGLTADYCLTFKEITIDGVTEFLNCQDARVQSSMDKSIENKVTGCPSGQNSTVVTKCVELVSNKNYDGKNKINGVLIGQNDSKASEFCNNVFPVSA